ncbi:hypothetical protein AWC23_25950 [Mycobacterium saskatchewanense]|uniref:PPE family protein n=2 Tax=Mycobacterium saskatchewanense TaxID=220927 RepID=A0AAJ3TU92_9MYCO|nr:hypothetical protein AWC23_25950 [Mycobacterium saskatchewanense]
MYTGAGAAPMMAAASAWDGAAAELSWAAASYQSVVSELTGSSWLGASSASMADAASPFVAWMNTTAAQAETTANQARSAAAAYEAAFAATVPPPVIEANRTLLAALVATNILGQNTSAIAATEAEYAEMWAQDATAMYGYAASSAAATQLSTFIPAQQNTNEAGMSEQAAAVSQATSTSAATDTSSLQELLSSVPEALSQLSSNVLYDPMTWLENFLALPLPAAINEFAYSVGSDSTALSGIAFLASIFPFFVAPLMALAVPAETAATAADSVTGPVAGSTLVGSGSSGAGASAALGESVPVGGLSVPPSWGTAMGPEVRLVSAAFPAAGLPTMPEAALGSPGLFGGGMPPLGSVVNAPRGSEAGSESDPRAKARARPAGQPSDPLRAIMWQEQPSKLVRAAGSDSELGDRERDELDELRRAIAEVAGERDAAAKLIREAIQP